MLIGPTSSPLITVYSGWSSSAPARFKLSVVMVRSSVYVPAATSMKVSPDTLPIASIASPIVTNPPVSLPLSSASINKSPELVLSVPVEAVTVPS